MSAPRFGGVYRVTVTPADAGRRVTVRRVLPGGGDELGDVVGELLAWTDGVLAIRRRDGSVEQVPEASVVSARVVPPPPR